MKGKAIALAVVLTGCGALPLGTLGGGGPNVAANVQAGKENTQQLVANQERTEAGRDIITETKQVDAASVETVTINNFADIPIWYWIAFMIGWMAPSPPEMLRGFIGLFRRR
jgi:hypothetical protein